MSTHPLIPLLPLLPIIGLTTLTVLTGCETVTDTGLACVIPEGAGCQDYVFSDNDISEDENYEAYLGVLEGCETGVIVPETPIALRLFLGRDPGVASNLECDAEISGDFELTITSSFRWREERNESGVRGLWVDCETPPLGPGNWTFRYGESGVAYVPVPSLQAPIFCLDSGSTP